MDSHFLLLILFAFLVSIVFAVLQRDTLEAQLRLGLFLFGGFVIAALVLGYVMLPFPLARP